MIREAVDIPVEQTMAYSDLSKLARWIDNEWGTVALINAIDFILGRGDEPDPDPVELLAREKLEKEIKRLRQRGYGRGMDDALQLIRDRSRESLRQHAVGPQYDEPLSYLRNP